LRVRVALVQIEGCHFASEALFWKPVALGNIEHVYSLRNGTWRTSSVSVVFSTLETKYTFTPCSPFADDSADVEGLFECEPTLGCVPVRP
jgi:hypothetical protein